MDLLGRPIFSQEINWAQQVAASWSFDVRQASLGFGPETLDPRQQHVVHGWEFAVDLTGSAIDDLETFMDGLLGRANTFWLPGPVLAFRIEDGGSATSFIVTDQGAADDWDLHPGGYLWFRKAGQPSQFGRISGVVDNGDGTETVTWGPVAEVTGESSSSSSSDTAWAAEVVDETWIAQPLALVRMADDVERIEVMAERVRRQTFRVVELPNEYAALAAQTADAPALPVFLYRFRAEFDDGPAEWRYTSHPTDVTMEAVADQSSSSTAADDTSSSLSSSSSAESQSSLSSSSSQNSSSSSSSDERSSSSSSTSLSSQSSSSDAGTDSLWVSAPITHSRISRSTRLGGTATITADIDSVEPLRLLIPNRVAVNLTVEILRTNTNFDETETMFLGSVRSPQVDGRRITVKCVEWGDAMDQRIPRFFIQRECNYRVYDPLTCRASQASKEVAVSVTAAANRSARIKGAGLIGLAEDWFAQGWIELGSGIQTRRYFVVQSTLAAGDEVTVVTSQPITDELPVAATAVPGCDGKRTTCVSKFNNLVNFGGHETPRDNLTLVAIQTSSARGGKK